MFPAAAAIMTSMSSEHSSLARDERPPARIDRDGGLVQAGFSGLPRRLVPYVIVTVIANTAVAALLVLAMPQSHHSFAAHFVYSQFIGLSILLLVAVPRLTYWPRSRLGPWQAALHLALATIVGFVGGSFGASLLLDAPPLIRARQPGDNMLMLVALITVLASIGCSSFFWMRERVSALKLEASSERARAETASRQATEAQLNLVRTQLEPHMLFNTLANLRSLMTIDPPRAQLMVDRLISFLRATLAASRHDEVKLGDEFDVLRDYLELIAIRMGPRLSFSLQLPPALASIRVLPLLLQPLVENAVRHGLEPSIDGGRIDVRALVEGGRLILQVEDTGVGFTPACTSAPDEADRGSGFGLAQVRERLATAYGEAASLVVESPWGGSLAIEGTRVTLALPMAGGAPRQTAEPETIEQA
jgi:signal transduction histidine kinase